MCWGDRQQVQDLRKEVKRLRDALHDVVEIADGYLKLDPKDFVASDCRWPAKSALDRPA